MIFLICGMTCSGKTTFMNKIKSRSTEDHLFLDLDEEVSKAAGKEIAEIVDDSGVSVFRKIELETFKKIVQENLFFTQSDKKHLMISLGGGSLEIDELFHFVIKVDEETEEETE